MIHGESVTLTQKVKSEQSWRRMEELDIVSDSAEFLLLGDAAQMD